MLFTLYSLGVSYCVLSPESMFSSSECSASANFKTDAHSGICSTSASNKLCCSYVSHSGRSHHRCCLKSPPRSSLASLPDRWMRLDGTTAAEDAAEVEGAEDGGRHGRWQGPQEGQSRERLLLLQPVLARFTRARALQRERGAAMEEIFRHLVPTLIFCYKR